MSAKSIYFFTGCCGLALVAVGYWIPPETFSIQYKSVEEVVKKSNQEKAVVVSDVNTASVAGTNLDKVVVKHLPTPPAVKAIYMSQCVAGTKNFREELAHIADTTEINSIIIDIKDYSGKISFIPEDPKLREIMSDTCRASDMKDLIADLHDRGIYIIGRITVFQDPYMTKLYPERAVKSLSTGGVWKDNKGLSFIDVNSREHWDYIVALSKESYEIGFDELNFDYIRYPSDGNMKDTVYNMPAGKTKPEMLEEFFSYLHDALEPIGVVTSADLFGMTTTNKDDLNIGQVLERALPYFDYIAPMVYPSHYPKGFHNYENPNKNVYGVISYSMNTAVQRVKEFYKLVPPEPILITPATASTTAVYKTPDFKAPSEEEVFKAINKLRPWLQDFDYGGDYDIPEVQAQIKATYDAGLNSWMLWSPSNKYTVGAFKRE